MSAKVKDVMTRKVVAVHTSASFKEIAATLRDRRVSAFPVLDDTGTVIGVVSEADLITKEALEANDEAHPGPLSGLLHRRDLEKARGATAGELMSRPPLTVRPDDLVSHAAHLMHERRIKRLPVTDANGTLVGIISRTDVLSVFSRSDQDLRHQITQDVILGRYLTDPTTFTVIVKDGIVTLEGHPETSPLGHEIVAAVRHLEGVVAVRDRLSYPAPAEYVPLSGPLF
jgi:CBS domain-containing protein